MQAGSNAATQSRRSLVVAAVQSISRTGAAPANLRRAEKLVAEAASRGAELTVCPELLAPGYAFDRALWRDAEPRGGRTERWLQALARRHAMYLGAGYLEVDGDDFYNTFALVGPDGAVLGRVRKESLPGFEGWIFRSSELPKTFESPLGRVAVGICNDNHTARFFTRMLDERPDILLMPHSAPCTRVGAPVMREAVSEIGPFYARSFGIPTVMANKAADRSLSPIPVFPGRPLELKFPGMSTVTDSDGEVRARSPDEEGVIVASVWLDASRKCTPAAPQRGYWSRPPRAIPSVLGWAFERLEARAKRVYASERAQHIAAARALSSTEAAQPSAREETSRA